MAGLTLADVVPAKLEGEDGEGAQAESTEPPAVAMVAEPEPEVAAEAAVGGVEPSTEQEEVKQEVTP